MYQIKHIFGAKEGFTCASTLNSQIPTRLIHAGAHRRRSSLAHEMRTVPAATEEEAETDGSVSKAMEEGMTRTDDVKDKAVDEDVSETGDLKDKAMEDDASESR